MAGQGTNTGDAVGPLTVADPFTGPPLLFEAAVPPINNADGAFCLVPGPFGDRAFVASRVAGDIRVDAYAAS